MQMQMQTEAEAFACLAVLMAAADGVGTLDEGHYLFDTMARLPVFEGLDGTGFTAVLSEANRRVFSADRVDDGRVTDDGISSLLTQVRETLSPELRRQAAQMALELSRADEVSREEEVLMDRIRQELLLGA
jgi:hypothetical protein